MIEIRDLLEVRKHEFAVKIVERQYGLQHDFWKTYGDEGKKLSIRDAGYHLPFLAEAIYEENPEIFTHYVSWVKDLFTNLKFPDEVIKVTLDCMKNVLVREIPDYSEIIEDYINKGIQETERPSKLQSSYIDEKAPLGRELQLYLRALLAGDKSSASMVIMNAFHSGHTVKEIYLNIFQPAQYEVGRLWMTNQISVAMEHYCSAATQMIMSQLYPYIFTTERTGKTFIGACVGGELHEIGVRMVADFFEMEGWDTYYLGANTPVNTILKVIEEHQADILGLSVSIPYHRSLLKETIEKVRQSHLSKDLIILIGGIGVSNFQKNLNFFGADAYASNAMEAVELAKKLIDS